VNCAKSVNSQEIIMSYAYHQEAPPYPYDALATGDIRLLQIVPGILPSIIFASLKHFDLQKVPAYTALSYVWGQEPALHRIMVDNMSVFVRPNLFHALQRIRKRETPVWIWVDSLCINQLNDDERNEQIQRMAQIYQNAEIVFIWLGEEDAMTKPAFQVVEDIAHGTFSWLDGWWKQFGVLALGRLMHRTWFRRGWVIQEAAHAKSAFLCCGPYQVPLDVVNTGVYTVRRALRRLVTSTLYPVGNMSSAQVLDVFDSSPGVEFQNLFRYIVATKAGSKRQPHFANRLEILVGRTTYSQTTDQRDAIFALLSLASDIGPPQSFPSTIAPDYRRKVLDVFADFVLHCCKATGSLDVLCCPWAPLSSAASANLDMGLEIDRLDALVSPSWIRSRDDLPFGNPVHGWTHRIHADMLLWDEMLETYSAHRDTKARVSMGTNDLGTSNGSFFARGVVMCSIDKISSRMAGALIHPECLQMMGDKDPQGIGLSIIDQYTVLCVNRQQNGARPGRRYLDAMDYLMGTDLFIARQSSSSAEKALRGSSIDVEEILKMEGLPDAVREYLRAVRGSVWNRRMFLGSACVTSSTEKSQVIGLLPRGARSDDVVCILFGCSVPVVLRKTSNIMGDPGQCWQFIGEAYVHNYMNGEAFENWTEDELNDPEAGIEFKIR
jgi:hypothetical protein